MSSVVGDSLSLKIDGVNVNTEDGISVGVGIAVGAIVAGSWFVESDKIVVVGTCVDDNVGA